MRSAVGSLERAFIERSATQVERGAKVERGDIVGAAGRILAGIPGMYFEMRVDGTPVDPLEWLKKKP